MAITEEMKETLVRLGFGDQGSVDRVWSHRELEFRISERSLLRETPASLTRLIALVRRHRHGERD